MKKYFEENDIRKLYNAFNSLCDYVEENSGCGNCPLWAEMCGNKDKRVVEEFSEALARIRGIADISNP